MDKTYRQSVAIVVFNKDKKLLVCERLKSSGEAWQFPQGGIDKGENVEDAAYRELFEETSIKSAKLIKILETPYIYSFPEKIRRRLWQVKHYDKVYGQEQHWVLFYFYGNDNEIDLNTKEREFKNYKWESAGFAMESIVDFKRDVYTKALKELVPYIESYEV